MSQASDNAWKDVLERHFGDFLRFFFPGIHAAIDWSHPVEFLDKEFTRLVPRALRGKAIVDKLARVKLKSGEEAVVYIHVDVQGRPESGFEARLFRYNVRGRERFGPRVVTLVVLTEDCAARSPCAYEHELWGFRVRMEFPTVRLRDYRGREEGLRADPNPFSVVVLAHLLRMEDPELKPLYRSKLRLIRLLYKRGYDRQKVEDFILFLDWILRLPEPLEDRIIDTTEAWEGQKHMSCLTNAERRGIKKGRAEGLEEGKQIGREEGKQEGKQEGKLEGKLEGKREGTREGLLEAIALGLEIRFGAHSLELLPRVREIQDLEWLRRLVAELKTAPTLDAFRGVIETTGSAPAGASRDGKIIVER